MRSLIIAAAAAGLVAVGAGTASAQNDPSAVGTATGSPGILSGDNIQVVPNIPLNLCGNSVNVLALLNPAGGSTCTNS
ncbi:MAG: chaplin [Streptomycetaceae bacterium]|nr:chaplin [Streptomycetaceae bacterium]